MFLNKHVQFSSVTSSDNERVQKHNETDLPHPHLCCVVNEDERPEHSTKSTFKVFKTPNHSLHVELPLPRIPLISLQSVSLSYSYNYKKCFSHDTIPYRITKHSINLIKTFPILPILYCPALFPDVMMND